MSKELYFVHGFYYGKESDYLNKIDKEITFQGTRTLGKLRALGVKFIDPVVGKKNWKEFLQKLKRAINLI